MNAAALLWAQKPLRVREFSSSDSPLWKILHNHYEYFNAGHDKDCEKQYGFFRPVVDEVVEDYLRCGDLHEGFAKRSGK